MNHSLKIKKNNVIKKLLKYLLFGFIILISIRYIPSQVIHMDEVLAIASIGSISFGIIDIIAPSIIVK